MNEWVISVDQANFAEAVLARSSQLPVIVDFWAPWCGPCRTLTPMIEKLAEEYAGKFLLAKLNTDENPRLANEYRIQSIPRLIAFKDGRPAQDVVGALPLAELRRFIDAVVPSPAEESARAGEAAAAAGKLDEARGLFQAALELDPRSPRALIGLAQLLQGEDSEAALALLERVPPFDPARVAADRIAASIRVRGSGSLDESALRQRVDADPTDLQARFDLAHALAAGSRYEEALAALLEIIRRDRAFQDGAARKAMLDIFEILGPTAPAVSQYRDELAKVLFS